MNQKQIGIILIAAGILSSIFVLYEKVQDERNIAIISEQTGSCYLEDGTCLHNQGQLMFIFGGIISASLIILGVYLLFFDKTQKVLADQNQKVSEALHQAQKIEKEKDEFKAFLSAFSAEEQIVLKTISENEGITQSTLRFKVGMSKAYLSMMISDLEERGIISRKQEGKTYQIFLKMKF